MSAGLCRIYFSESGCATKGLDEERFVDIVPIAIGLSLSISFPMENTQGLKSLRENGRIWEARGAHRRSLRFATLRSG